MARRGPARRCGLVIHNWVLPDRWTDRHRLDIAVALFDDRQAVQVVTEQLVFSPFRHAELLDDLAAAGLRVVTTTYAMTSTATSSSRSEEQLYKHAMPVTTDHERRTGAPIAVLVEMPPGLNTLHRCSASVAGR